jgi:Flp pilus assembly protein TadD
VADIEEVLGSLQKEGDYWADLQLRGQDALIRGDFARARELLEKAVAIRPDLASLWTDLGIAWLGLKNDSQAESSFSQAVRADPGHPKALENYGTSLFRRGRTREALEAFRIAARTNPDDVSLLVNLGNAAAASGEMAEAQKTFDRAVSLDSESAEAWLGKGKVLAATSDAAGARAALQEALKLKPSLEEARVLLNRLPR